jgi:hypothetical protein
MIFLTSNEVNDKLVNNSLEDDLEHELALDMVEALEQDMVEETKRIFKKKINSDQFSVLQDKYRLKKDFLLYL